LRPGRGSGGGGGGGGAGSWVSASELDLPTYGATPLYVHCPSEDLGAGPRTAARAPLTGAKQGFRDASSRPKAAGGTGQGDTAPLADAGAALGRTPAGLPPRLSLHGIGPAATPAGAALISPGSERSTGGSGDDGGGSSGNIAEHAARRVAHQRGPSAGIGPPGSIALTGRPSVACTPKALPRFGMSVDTGMATFAATAPLAPQTAAAAERRRKLEEFRQQKAAAAAAQPKAKTDAEGFKQPVPRPPTSVFRATAAMLDAPASSRRAGGTWRASSCGGGGGGGEALPVSSKAEGTGGGVRGAAARGPRASGQPEQPLAETPPPPPPVPEPSPASSMASGAAGGGGGGGSSLTLGAFTATMATLQQAKASSPALAPGSGGLSKPLPVPKLSLHLLGQTPPGQQQPQPQQRVASAANPAPAPAPAAASAASAAPHAVHAAAMTPRTLQQLAASSRIPRTPSADLSQPAGHAFMGTGEAAAAATCLQDPATSLQDALQAGPADVTPRGGGLWRDVRRASQLPRTPSGLAAAAEEAATPPLMRRGSGMSGIPTPREAAGAAAAAASMAMRGGAATGATTPRGALSGPAGGRQMSGIPSISQQSPQPGQRTTPRGHLPFQQQHQQQQASAAALARTPHSATPSRTPRGSSTGLTPRAQPLAASLTPRARAPAPHGHSQQLPARPPPAPVQPAPAAPSLPLLPQADWATALALDGKGKGAPEEQVSALREAVRVIRMQEMQWRYLRARTAAAAAARRAKVGRGLELGRGAPGAGSGSRLTAAGCPA
jgi:hypothetical protein